MKNDLTKYNAVRDDLHTGDVITFAGSGLVSLVIRLATQRSHVALVVRLRDYEGDEKRRFILEANGIHGISLHLLSSRLREYSGKAWWLQLREEFSPVRPYIGTWAFAQIGTSYDYPGLFLNALGRVSDNARAYFCSEYAWLAIRQGMSKAAAVSFLNASHESDYEMADLRQRIFRDFKRIGMKAARPGDFLKFTSTFKPEVPIL
ncbi:MAG: hypothetical protein JW884_14180 [Deltaproteobacteria bacterium]|nr:hypothetical protein [Deltaproteobacteria bacterium]